MNETVELRVHHATQSAKKVYQEPHSLAHALALQGYLSAPELSNPQSSNFVNLSFSFLKELFDNPNQKVRLTDSADTICESCTKKEDCLDRRALIGSAFSIFGSKQSIQLLDEQEAKKYNLNINQVYTSQELRKIIGF